MDETYEEAWRDATPEEREHLHPLDYDDPRYEAEMDYWDAEEEVLDEMGWGW